MCNDTKNTYKELKTRQDIKMKFNKVMVTPVLTCTSKHLDDNKRKKSGQYK